MESKVYNQKGAEAGNIKLPKEIFDLKWNESLIHQVAVSMMSNARIPWAHAKNRGEVSGTGKKPWRQKGTGRARHGSTRSPIWVGGGTTHGPRNERDYSRKINKKTKTKALFTALSKKFKDNEVIFVENISFKAPKTKEAKQILTSLSKIKDFSGLNKKRNAAFVALDNKNENTIKSFNNFGNVELGLIKDLNVLDLLNHKNLIIVNPEKSLEILKSKK